MFEVIFAAIRATVATFKSRRQLGLEILALRHQVQVLRRGVKRPALNNAERLLWVGLKKVWPEWKDALVIVRPETVVGWQRKAFRAFWRWKSRPRGGRPSIDPKIIHLIRRMWKANPTWGSIRIQDELAHLGLQVSDATVRKYRPQPRKPSSQTWRSFLNNHVREVAAMDFFIVPTATFRVLYVFVVMAHHRRRVVHFNVTDSPTAAWTAQQIRNAFPEELVPKYLLRDRDGIYGAEVVECIHNMGIEQKRIAPHSPWQNPFVERLIGSIRRECLDHMIILNAAHLQRILQSYLGYYHHHRPHRSLEHDSPLRRAVEQSEQGRIIELPCVGGLHHRYTRKAA
jgi:transposase InsO family protein